jgi:hypothetical protein
MSIDLNNMLSIKIENTRPVSLMDLSSSLLGISSQFDKFVDISLEASDVRPNLIVSEIKKGSIVVEVITQSLPILPLIWNGGSLLEWFNQAKDTIEWLTGRLENAPTESTKKDLQQWNNILEPIAKDHGSQMILTVNADNVTINNYHINSIDANTAQNNIRRQIAESSEPSEQIHRAKVMYWNQAKFSQDTNTGDKAIIDDISDKPLKVIFSDNTIKNQMLNSVTHYEKPWHELAYLVDVEIQTIKGVPKLYKILSYYPEGTFDPAD